MGKEKEIKKIVIIGPESTGKSTLCSQLAQRFNTLWCPEYAREYLLKNGMLYTYEDLLHIAKGQVKLEEEYLAKVDSMQLTVDSQPSTVNSKMLFIDTDMYVMKVWCEFVFGKCHPWILQTIVERKYDHYLLCAPDLPWVKDELREYPDLESREVLFKMYKDILVNQDTPWSIIEGNENERLEKAAKEIRNMK